ncbi:MAG: DNA alkylation repair protein [Acidobacteriaceae bacterium]|nr:DNA alkylation repair protein [Acidobacteriaceae bacterium]
MAYELVRHHAEALERITKAEVEQLGQGMSSWSDVDGFGCYVSGPAWRLGRIGTACIERWAKSKDVWWRRAALVSTVPLNAHGSEGDAARTLQICTLLVADREDMIVKALSWALRALAKRDPDAVKAFIDTYENSIAARALRETRNWLRTGRKSGRSLVKAAQVS